MPLLLLPIPDTFCIAILAICYTSYIAHIVPIPIRVAKNTFFKRNLQMFHTVPFYVKFLL